MRYNNTKNCIYKKNFKKVGLFLGVQSEVKKSVNDYIGAPAANLAKPVF